jgi:integrase
MLAHAARRRGSDPSALVFATSTGTKMSASNVRNRVLAPAVMRANGRLAERDAPALPNGLTPHSLRRTFASVLIARGDDPAYVMAQMGHTTPNLTLSLYARAMQRRDGEPERLRALVEGAEWAEVGTSSAADRFRAPGQRAA